MHKRKWTDEQRKCIEARGGTLLVSAAAGSGKTSVLVERVINLITDDQDPVDIDKLLVVTFTKAAASEMKQRLSSALSDYIAKNPEDIRLQRQQMLLANANISTVDAFCSALLRDHFHLAGLTPQFRVADETEVAQLKDEAVNEVIEDLYRQGDPQFCELATLLSPGKDDEVLIKTILSIYDFVQSHPFPEKWLEEKQAMYTSDAPIEKMPWGRVVLDHAQNLILSAASLISRAAALAEQEPVMAEKYLDTLEDELNVLKEASEQIVHKTWQEARDMAAMVCNFKTLPQLRKYHDEMRKQRVKALRDKAKKVLRDKLTAIFCGSVEQCRADISAMAGMSAILFDAVRRYEQRFSQKKRQRGLVDFNDMEHLALRILIDESGKKTPVAVKLSESFEYVMVDEYQDTNAAQDALFRALSRDENNLFMVGDVKQSIYGFRQAMPEIFLNRKNSYPEFDKSCYPATITLGNNFRSRQEVTDAVNFVFGQLMTKAVGRIEYDEREKLTASAPYEPADGYETELLIIDDDTREPTDSVDAVEARLIAARIKDMAGKFTVTENGRQRPAEYKDFCILLRSKNTHAKAYADELARHGIPVWTASSGGFFSAYEVSIAVSLLRIIDNPVQDIPLLAVMLSPLFGFIPDDLAEIRLHTPKGRHFTALSRYARSGNQQELKNRVLSFLGQIDNWRMLAVTMPADRLIHRIYEDTALTSIALSMQGGSQRVANLRLLHDTAQRFEQKGFRGLSAFVRMLDRAERHGKLSAAPASAAGNAVRIMSIHQSKGLEFPIVFIAGLGRRFNKESSNNNLVLHTDMGVGFKRRDPEILKQWNTLPRQAVSLAVSRSDYAEEIRVLYVAMTRAKEKLCMIMTTGSVETKLASLAAVIGDGQVLPPNAILDAACMGDWILSAALRHPSADRLRTLAGDDSLPVFAAQTAWHIDLLRSPRPVETQTEISVMPPPDTQFLNNIKERIEYNYPYAKVSALPAKLAASALSHREIRRETAARLRPAFLSERGLTPAERGTALHTFMQFTDYKAAAMDVHSEIERLVSNGFLTPLQGKSIQLQKLKKFFDSPLYTRMERSERLLREVHFTIDIPACELSKEQIPEAADEIIVVQGIADCVIVEDNSLVVVDYKTDNVKSGETLIKRYIEQLLIYSRALQRTLGLPVRECILYSFALNSSIDATAEVLKIQKNNKNLY